MKMTTTKSFAATSVIGVMWLCVATTDSFQMMPTAWTTTTTTTTTQSRRPVTQLAARKTLLKEQSFDPLELTTNDIHAPTPRLMSSTPYKKKQKNDLIRTIPAAAAAAATTALTVLSEKAVATENLLSTGTLSPENFQPVCPTSDGFYRLLQQTALSLVGKENFVDYGPLIAGGLLRVRLELCVVESFFNEAVGPFIRDNGISWILPLHETVETFLAGGIFAVATTFILIGSTKILTVIFTYADFLLGFPARLFGGFAFDRAQGKPVTLDIGFGPFKTRVFGPPEPKEDETAKNDSNLSDASPVKLVVLVVSGAVNLIGQILGFGREALEAIDAFVGRYLVLWASGYLLIKFLHFKVFPDFP